MSDFMKGTLAVLGGLALVSFLVWVGIENEKAWQKYSAEHHCKLIHHVDGYYISTVLPDGKGGVTTGTTYVPEQNTYRCDNDLEITR